MSTTSAYTIGVLDIQGSVEEHMAALKKIGARTVAVKLKTDLNHVDGLIIPGGESTAIGKLLKTYGLISEIKKRSLQPTRPLVIWGTCAGAILLSKKVIGKKPDVLELMDVNVARNAYGRQIDSFRVKVKIPVIGKAPFDAIFIRAPQIRKCSKSVRVLAKYGSRPIMAQQGNLLITTFHPELTSDGRVHKYFLSLVKQYAEK